MNIDANSPQNTSKLNTAINEKNYIPLPSRMYPKNEKHQLM